jgi:O-acetyl-ADP-ribose deacetylase (regulator of RNase III)
MRRTVAGLTPDDDAARDALRRVQIGEIVRVDVQRPRSHKNLRRWWALCNLITQNSDTIKSPEQAHDLLKIMAGHCTHIVSQSTGEVYQIADSIAFGRISEDEFQDVWQRAVKAVTEHILPGITDEDLEREILQIIGAASFR